MQISSKFTIAIHMLLCAEIFGDSHKVTSDFMAGSIGTNPVIVRNILKQLKDANIINVIRGTGGVEIIKPINQITLYDIYVAVDTANKDGIFSFHKKPNKNCPIGQNIHKILDDKLKKVEEAFDNELRKTTLLELVKNTKNFLM